jgi:O-antigen ligase
VIQFLRTERLFLGLILLWVATGIVFAFSSWIIVPVSLMLLRRKRMYMEMLMGFFVVLMLSDSRQYILHFAADIKDVYLLLLAFFYFTDRASFAPEERLIYRFLPFIVIAVLFIPLSDVVMTTLQKTISYVLLFLIVPNYLAYGWRTQGEKALRNFIWAAMVVLAAGFVLRVISPGMVTLAGRYSGMLGNPNGLGLLCTLLFLLISLITEIVPGILTRREQYTVWALIFGSLILCGSRSATFTVLLFITMRYFYRIAPALGVFVFLVLVLVYQVILNNLEPIIIYLNLQEYFRLETFQNASGRLIAWEFGWAKITENPLIGNGIGYTEYYYRKNYDFLSALGHQGNAHNSYITFWIDTGILGLLSFVIAAVSSFLAGAKRISAAVPALLAIFFSAFFESWLTASLNPFTIQFVAIMMLLASPMFKPEAVEEHRELIRAREAGEEITEEEDAADEKPNPAF